HGANESFSIDQRVIRISLDIEDVNDFPVEHGAAGDRTSARRNRMRLHVLLVRGRIAVGGEMFENLAHWARDGGHIRLAQTGCRSKVERLMTLSTSAVAVCCANDSRSSFSSRVFSIAMMAWAAKVLRSAICLSVNGSTTARRSIIVPTAASSRRSGTASVVR